MFNCVYSDGSVISTNDIGECVAPHPVTGADLLDITESATTIEVTTEAPTSAGWVILAGVGLLLLLASSTSRRRSHAELL